MYNCDNLAAAVIERAIKDFKLACRAARSEKKAVSFYEQYRRTPLDMQCEVLEFVASDLFETYAAALPYENARSCVLERLAEEAERWRAISQH